MSEQITRLSMEEFLSMNQEYAEHKKKFLKNNTKNTILGVLSGFVIVPITIFIIIFIKNILFGLGIMALGIAALALYIIKSENKSKNELEEKGGTLYQEYLKENGFIK